MEPLQKKFEDELAKFQKTQTGMFQIEIQIKKKLFNKFCCCSINKDLNKHISQRQLLESQLTENKFVKEVRFSIFMLLICCLTRN